MLAPPSGPFDVPLWIDEAKVHPDHHIQVARALYSVPSTSGAKVVRARADKASVKIYAGTLLIKVHPRQPPGGRSTDPSDYPSGKAAYALRSVDALVARAKDKGNHVGVYAERLLGGPLPWARMRAAYALLRLCDKFGEGRVEAVCQSALAFDVVDVARVLGPVGVGKTFVSQALGHIACNHGYNSRFLRADTMLRTLRQSRLGNSRDAEMISLTSVDLLTVDDFALEPMSKEESRDVYQLWSARAAPR